jgi:hypothetical protein
MAHSRDFSHKFWEDKNGNIVVVQKPGLPIIVFIVAAIIYVLFQNGGFGKFFGWVAVAALVVWALLEIFRGVNYFRRLLGVAVLLLVALFWLP